MGSMHALFAEADSDGCIGVGVLVSPVSGRLPALFLPSICVAMGITASPTLAMARTWVPDPVFKPIPTLAAGPFGFSSMLLPVSESSIIGHVSGSPNPVVDGSDGRLGSGKSSATLIEIFRTAGSFFVVLPVCHGLGRNRDEHVLGSLLVSARKGARVVHLWTSDSLRRVGGQFLLVWVLPSVSILMNGFHAGFFHWFDILWCSIYHRYVLSMFGYGRAN